jgi:superfamily I DNA/RNA helicase
MEQISQTEQQSHILSLARGTNDNILITALAGTGKSTMLELIEQARPAAPILYLSFGKLDSQKAAERVGDTTTVRTFNSLGHRIWNQYVGRNCKPDITKCANIYKGFINAAPSNKRKDLWEIYSQVLDGVQKAKALGYIPSTHAMAKQSACAWADVIEAMEEAPDPFVRANVDKILTASIKAAYDGQIDFDDQVYMASLFGGTFPSFPLVLGDEAQDWNPINWVMYDKLVKSSRGILVGDPNQSIYAFRGAVPQALARAQRRYAMVSAGLTVSFRCPRRIVEHVHWHVPDFRWNKEGGSVVNLGQLTCSDVHGSATFICRNNAPLYRLALLFLGAGHSVNVQGADIGPRLLNQMKRLTKEDTPRAKVLELISEWEYTREIKGSKTAKDTAECMRVFASHGANLGQALVYAKHLFAQEGKLVFTTGHKAKGREWDTVFIVDNHLLRSGEDQEDNLAYVMATRSANQLYYIDSRMVTP